MTTWYRIDTIDETPHPCEVESESAQYVVVKGRRTAKTTDWCAIRPTREAAWQWLIDKRQRAVDDAGRKFAEAKAKLRKVELAAEAEK